MAVFDCFIKVVLEGGREGGKNNSFDRLLGADGLFGVISD